MSTEKPRLIYIVGTGRSGSTLLDLMLDGSPQVESVGELQYLDLWIEYDGLCSCGTPISRCDFWNTVIGRVPRPDILPLIGDYRSKSPIPRFASTNADLFRRISHVSGAQVIVDSSKSLRRLKWLASPGDIEIFVIHLVRDGRAYLSSRLKLAPHPRVIPYSERRPSVLHVIARWVSVTLAIKSYLRRWPKHRKILVRYEDLAAHPECVMRDICSRFRLPYSDAMVRPSTREIHNISGSGWRFKEQSAVSVKLDSSWQRSLKMWHRLVFLVVGGAVNRLLGYSAWRMSSDGREKQGSE